MADKKISQLTLERGFFLKALPADGACAYLRVLLAANTAGNNVVSGRYFTN